MSWNRHQVILIYSTIRISCVARQCAGTGARSSLTVTTHYSTHKVSATRTSPITNILMEIPLHTNPQPHAVAWHLHRASAQSPYTFGLLRQCFSVLPHILPRRRCTTQSTPEGLHYVPPRHLCSVLTGQVRCRGSASAQHLDCPDLAATLVLSLNPPRLIVVFFCLHCQPLIVAELHNLLKGHTDTRWCL